MNAKLFWQTALMLLTGVIFLFYLVEPDLMLIRVGYGLLLIFFLPGYMILTAVFTTDLLGIPERIAYATSLSMATAALVGLVLNLIHWGLITVAWVSVLTAISLFFGALGFMRLMRIHVNVDADISAVAIGFREMLLILVAGVIVALALLLARSGAEQAPADRYTEFWMLPRPAEEAPVFELGIRNYERQPVDYRLVLRTRNNVIEEWAAITLDDGEIWQAQIAIPERFMISRYLSAQLYRLDDPTHIYRQLTIDHD